MNLKTIGVALTLILIVILAGVVISNIGDENTSEDPDPVIDDNVSVDDNENNELIDSSKLPSGITTDNGVYSINKIELISDHKSTVIGSSITSKYNRGVSSRVVRKSGDKIHIDRGDEEVYYDGVYKITKSDDKYDAKKTGIDKNEYTFESKLSLLLTEMSLDSVSEDSNGDIIISLQLESNESTIRYNYGFNSIRSASADLRYSTDDEIIDLIDVEVYGNNRGSIEKINEEYSITDVGSTDLNRPSWMSVAENSVSVVIGTINTNENVLRLKHEGLASMKKGTKIYVKSDSGTEQINISESFEKGQTLFLAPTENGWKHNIGSLPSGTRTDIDKDITVHAEDNGGNRYFELDF